MSFELNSTFNVKKGKKAIAKCLMLEYELLSYHFCEKKQHCNASHVNLDLELVHCLHFFSPRFPSLFLPPLFLSTTFFLSFIPSILSLSHSFFLPSFSSFYLSFPINIKLFWSVTSKRRCTSNTVQFNWFSQNEHIRTLPTAKVLHVPFQAYMGSQHLQGKDLAIELYVNGIMIFIYLSVCRFFLQYYIYLIFHAILFFLILFMHCV